MGSDRKAMATLGASLLCCCSFTASGQTADACRRIDDSSGRLACYDHVFPRAPAPSAAGRPTPSDARSAGTAPGADTPVQAPPAAEHPAAIGDFGLNQRQLVQSGRVEKAPDQKSVSGLVSRVEIRADGRFEVALDNGQVWEQAEPDAFTAPRLGDRVTVRRGTLGSFQLVTARHVATRVRRVR